MLTLTNVNIHCCTQGVADNLPARGSMRSRGAAAVSTVTLRQISAVLPPERAWALWASRQIVARVMDAFGPSLAGTRVEHIDVRTPDGRRVIGEWVYGAGVTRGGSAIYYLHGSGYALCSPRTHRRLTSWLSRLTGLPVFCVDYRLAPKHRFPAAADDVRAGWDWLQDQHGVAPERMVIAGDSSGRPPRRRPVVATGRHTSGGHGADVTADRPHLRAGRVSVRTLRRDPAVRVRDAERLVGLYCAGTDLTHPRLTLDVERGRLLPPTLIQAGGAEMLVADSRGPGRRHLRRGRRVRAAGLARPGARVPGAASSHA